MRKVLRVGEKGKTKLEPEETANDQRSTNPGRTDPSLNSHGLEAVGEVLAQEVEQLAGPKYSRTGGKPGHCRWGSEAGSVYLGDQKLPINRPRVRKQKGKVGSSPGDLYAAPTASEGRGTGF